MTFLLLFAFLFWVLPVVCCINICEKRNRNPNKGAFLGFFFGWFAAASLWLALKSRDPATRLLY